MFPHRLHIHRGNAYLIRDVFDGEPYDPERFVGCEYGKLTETGVQWFTCIEGTDFADIEPFCVVCSNDETVPA